jgi:hypothetical protein
MKLNFKRKRKVDKCRECGKPFEPHDDWMPKCVKDLLDTVETCAECCGKSLVKLADEAAMAKEKGK